MIIKSGYTQAVISLFGVSIGYFLLMYFAVGAKTLALIMGLLLFCFAVRYWAAIGKTLIISKDGCMVRWLWYRRVYSWEELKVRRCFQVGYEYRCSATKGVEFSKKAIRRPAWLGSAAYAIWVHPLSYLFVYFYTGKPSNAEIPFYMATENEFREKLMEYGVSLD